MSRTPIPTWFFALCVVRDGARFLLVRERKGAQGWYLPAGRVEPGETLTAGAIREALEESRVPVALEGVLRIEHSPRAGQARVRAFFLARPADDTPPGPTDDSLDAGWFTLDEAARLHLRSPEVLTALGYVARGGAVAPLSILTVEGAPWA